MNVYPFIGAEKAQQRNLKRACELLESPVAPTTPTVPTPSACQRADGQLSEHIRQTTRPPRAATAHHASMPSFAVAATGTPGSGWPGCCAPRACAVADRAGGSRPPSPIRRPPWRTWCAATLPSTPRRSTPAGVATSPTSRLGRLAVPGDRDRHRLPPGGRVGLAEHLRTEPVADALPTRSPPRPRTRGGVPCRPWLPGHQRRLRHARRGPGGRLVQRPDRPVPG